MTTRYPELMQKVADLVIQPRSKRRQKKAVTTAGGIFVSHDKPDDSSMAREVVQAIRTHGSIQEAKAALKKKYPDRFVTAAFKRENKPGGLRYGVKRIFRPKRAKSQMASFKSRSANPRIFVRTGKPAGHEQSSFYKEVQRGLYDSELTQPHVKKKDRVVYS